MNTSETIITALTPLGLNVRVGGYPEGENGVVLIYAEDDTPVTYFMGTDAAIERQNVLVKVRGADAAQLVTRLEQIEAALRSAGTRESVFVKLGGLISLDNDANGQAQMAVKFKHLRKNERKGD